MSDFVLSEKVDKNKIFLIKKSDLLDRWDPLFYSGKHSIGKFNPLSRYVRVKGGKRIPKGKTYSTQKTEYLYLRVVDITNDGYIDYSNAKYISKDIYDELKRYEIFEGDIAFSIAGTIGRVVCIKGIPPNTHVILTENCAKIIVSRDIVNPDYLCIVLNLTIIQKQIERNSIQTTIPKLGLDRILNLMVPIFPSLDKQKEIVKLYDSAYSLRAQKLHQAKELLDSIDSYLLNELGITLPKTHYEGIKDRMFLVKHSDVVGKRLDPFFYRYLGGSIRSIKYTNSKLSNIAYIMKGNAITSDVVNKEGKYPVIAGGQTSPYNHDKSNYSKVITVSASGAYSGYVWYHDYPIFASDCSVIYSINEERYLTKYIFEVLKALQQQIYLLQQGAGQPHVYPEDLGKLYIPDVDFNKQQEIVNTISSIRQQAKDLELEGERILEEAKKEIEKIILG